MNTVVMYHTKTEWRNKKYQEEVLVEFTYKQMILKDFDVEYYNLKGA
jgi:hypothetical protein